MSNWSTLCDAVLTDLASNVPGLRGALQHRYSPYDPSDLIAESGERHIAVYPVAASAQTAEPLVTGPRGDLLTEVYRIVYWEDAGDESSRAVSDEDAASDLLDLAQAVRDRFYIRENYAIGGSDVMDTRYIGTALPDRAGAVRWFAIGVQTRRNITGT